MPAIHIKGKRYEIDANEFDLDLACDIETVAGETFFEWMGRLYPRPRVDEVGRQITDDDGHLVFDAPNPRMLDIKIMAWLALRSDTPNLAFKDVKIKFADLKIGDADEADEAELTDAEKSEVDEAVRADPTDDSASGV